MKNERQIYNAKRVVLGGKQEQCKEITKMIERDFAKSSMLKNFDMRMEYDTKKGTRKITFEYELKMDKSAHADLVYANHYDRMRVRHIKTEEMELLERFVGKNDVQ